MLQQSMTTVETELEMVRRHVLEGERHVSRQLAIISSMKTRNERTGLAGDLLFSFYISLRAHKAHLEQLTSN